MQRFLDFFEQRNMTVDLSIIAEGKTFTLTQARTERNGHEVVAEGLSRRSLDHPDPERAQKISGGRAIKALYLKVKYLEEKERISGRPSPKLVEDLRLLEKKYKAFIQGHVHLLMG